MGKEQQTPTHKRLFTLRNLIIVLSFLSIFHSVYVAARSNKSPTDLISSKCLNGASKTRAAYEADLASWKNCRWQRSDVINMTGMGFDLNGDKFIDAYEIEFARHYYFSAPELIMAESTKEVMEHCDCDGDGVISEEDFLNSDMSCIRNCDKAAEVWYFLGSRIKNGIPYTGVNVPNEKDRPKALDHLYAQ